VITTLAVLGIFGGALGIAVIEIFWPERAR
jgi:hypothetical protein